MTKTKNRKTHPWLKKILIAAGIYNLIFGAVCVLTPNLIFELVKMDAPKYAFLWQCIGMIVGVYGIGYIAASKNYITHWPIILVGLLGKIFGPIGFLDAAINQSIKWEFGYIIILNDLIWLFPFTMMLIHACKSR